MVYDQPKHIFPLRDAPDEMLLSPPETARLLGVSRRHLDRLHAAGIGPPAVKLGLRAKRYPLGPLRRWLALSTTQTLQQAEVKSGSVAKNAASPCNSKH
jgi:predicted DNA-binding transcriptional regulator AlpA